MIASHFRSNVESYCCDGDNFFENEGDGALDSTDITLQQHGADCDFRHICIDTNGCSRSR